MVELRGDVTGGPGLRSAGARTPGADRVYGEPLDGVEVVEVPQRLAPLFAEAHHRITGREAGVHRGGGAIVGRDGEPLRRPPSVPPDRWLLPEPEAVRTLAAAHRPVVLAGPDVVLQGAVPGLHALAAAASVGVLNTWGAKGVFDWRSHHHLGTVGLQERDFDLAGLDEVDAILVTGLHRREAAGHWQRAPIAHVHPWSLAPLAERWRRPPEPIVRPPLFGELARVTQAGWLRTQGPLPPTKLTQHYGRVLGGGGLVTADPGNAGFWVARTLGTTGVGGALVTADRDAVGFAVAAAIVARLVDPGRSVLGVVDELGDRHHELLEVAERLGVPVALEVWSADGPTLDADAHEARLERLVERGGTAEIGTSPHQLDEVLAVAGPIVAWTT